MIKVSIITVCLNSEKYIEQTIKSVLHQTYKEIEYIIVDGKSTDNTLSIVDKYKPLFGTRLRVISEKDNGLYDAMNKGIINSTGELIGIINSDDWYENDAVERAVEEYKKNQQRVIYGGVLRIRDNKISNIDISDYHELPNSMLNHTSVFVPKILYKKYGFFNCNYKIAADYDLMLKLFKNEVEFKFIPITLAYFREGGISAQNNKICIQEQVNIKRKYGYEGKEYTIDPRKNSKIKFFWDNLIGNINKKTYKNVYVYGRGSHTHKLLYYIENNTIISIKGVIDRRIENKDEKFLNTYYQYELEDIEDKADAIIISSISYEYDIYNRIKYLGNKVDIVRIYSVDSTKEANEIIKNFVVE